MYIFLSRDDFWSSPTEPISIQYSILFWYGTKWVDISHMSLEL